MKKLIYSIALLIFLFTATASVQAQSYEVGTNVINAGIGFGNYVSYGGGSATPVIAGSFEHGVTELGPGTLGLGAEIGYQGNSYSFSDFYYTYKETWSTTMIGIRGTWHPDVLVGDKYDVYGGLQLGYYHYGYSYTSNAPFGYHSYSDPLSSGIGLGVIVGGRYYFTNNIGAFAELGWDIAFIKLGLAVKFGAGK